MEQIAYRCRNRDDVLYVNIIENYNCLNECVFCSRPRTCLEYGKPNSIEIQTGQLFLERIPADSEVLDSIKNNLGENDREICFTGLGEPLLYFEKVTGLIRKIKRHHPGIIINLNTCGLAGLYIENPVKKLEKAGLDAIKISLNAVNEDEYVKLCKPKLAGAFPALLKFIGQCNSSSIRTWVSFIIGFDNNQGKINEYRDFALSLGLSEAQIIWRNFFPHIQE